MKNSLLLALSIFGLSSPVLAETNPLEYYLSLDIENLAQITVYSASKRNEKISDASASITKYDSREIRTLGYYTLGDLSDITAGYSSHTRFGERVFETRGQRASSFNNDKHLLLVDGVPIHHARNYKVPIEEELPLYFAESVEFIRGPSSALYGTSAFFGAITVDPLSYDEDGFYSDWRISGGMLDEYRQVLNNSFLNSSWGASSFYFGYTRKNASKDFVGVTPNDEWKNYNDREAFFAYAKHKLDHGVFDGLSLNALYSRKKSGHGEFFTDSTSSAFNKITWESFIPFVKYEKPLNSQIDLNGYIKYNHSREIGEFIVDNNNPTTASQYESAVQNFEVNTEVSYKLSDQTNMILGANFDARRERGWPDSSAYKYTASGWEENRNTFSDTTKWFQTKSYYGQYQHSFNVLEGLMLTAGARYDQGKAENQKYSQLSPRLSLNQKLTENVNLKLAYSTALRAPGIKETGLNNEGNERVGSLSPEKFRTGEVGVNYHNSKVLAGITFYESQTSDAITAFTVNTENKFRNLSGTTRTQGVETEIKYKTDFGIDLLANLSFSHSEDPDGNELADIPSHKANFVVLYNDQYKNMPYSLALINKWTGPYTVSDNSFNESGQHFTLDLNGRLSLGSNSILELKINNLFDNDYELPNNNQPQVPAAGRNVLLSFTRTF